MFRVKICGVTREADALGAIAAGADAIGLNFYPKSPRCVPLVRAVEIAAATGADLLRVGVFVNATAEEIATTVEAGAINAIQLHGDEPTALLADLPAGVPVVRAVRMADTGLAPAARLVEEADRLGRPWAAVLVDAAGAPGVYGGTGQTADWERLASERGLVGDTPLVLAGGLGPSNVAEGLRATGADGVDTASGVEASPGVKDPTLVRGFVEAALAELARSRS